MFGKTKDSSDTSAPTEATPGADIVIDDFFGDEAAVAEAVRIDNLHQRLTGVEQQINSQFTSMAAYAQISQEQVELVRSEAQHENERSERRVIGLIERERADRESTGSGSSPDLLNRIDALEVQVIGMREAIHQCLSNQKALADAITDLFSQPAQVAVPSPPSDVPTDSTSVSSDLTADEVDADELAPDALGADALNIDALDIDALDAEELITEELVAEEAVTEEHSDDEMLPLIIEPNPDTPLLGTDDFMGHDSMPKPLNPVSEEELFPAYSVAEHAELVELAHQDSVHDVAEVALHDDADSELSVDVRFLDADRNTGNNTDDASDEASANAEEVDTDFDVFAAPDIATIEPMNALPAPVLSDTGALPHPEMPHPDIPAPDISAPDMPASEMATIEEPAQDMSVADMPDHDSHGHDDDGPIAALSLD